MVLRAASCWDTWHQAVSYLMLQGLAKETAAKFLNDAYWDLTRIPGDEYTRITSHISQNGLNGGCVRLHTEDWHDDESLLMIVWTPPAGFVHLLNEVGLKERDLVANHYHISICYMKDLYVGWYQWKRRRVMDLWSKYSMEVRHDFTVEWWGSGGSLHISQYDEIGKDIYHLWKDGGYGWKSGLHISL